MPSNLSEVENYFYDVWTEKVEYLDGDERIEFVDSFLMEGRGPIRHNIFAEWMEETFEMSFGKKVDDCNLSVAIWHDINTRKLIHYIEKYLDCNKQDIYGDDAESEAE